MSRSLANSNYPQFQKARNFLLDEGVCMDRANPYLTSMEPRIASTAWTELHGERMTSRVWLPRGKAHHGIDPIAQCAETFALKPDFLRYGSASPSLTLIRCEEPRVIYKIARDSGFIDLANEARLLGLLRGFLAKPNDAQLREDLQEVLDIYAEYADARPIFAAFEEDLQEALKDEDMWQDHLRNALGLSHIKQDSQVILLRYPVARIPSVPGLANTRALVCPFVLDNALSNAFCPSPANAPTGHTVHLAPEDFNPCREALHPWIKWQAKDIIRLGEIKTAPPPEDEAARVYAECIERFPDSVVARAGLAEVLREQGRLDDAEAQYLDTIERFPDDVVARAGLAEVLREQGRLDDAEAQYPMERFTGRRGGAHRLGGGAQGNGTVARGQASLRAGVENRSDKFLCARAYQAPRPPLHRQEQHPAACPWHIVQPSPGFKAAAHGATSGGDTGGDLAAMGRERPSLRHDASRTGVRSARRPSTGARPRNPAGRIERIPRLGVIAGMEAQAAGTALTEEARQKVLAAPMNLRKRFPDMEPVYWLEHGLAYHALTDGQVRLDAVAESFDRIKLIANQQVNPHDPDALFEQGWAAGVMRLTGAAGDLQALAQRISELSHQLDVREEEPVLRREAAGRWQPAQLDSH